MGCICSDGSRSPAPAFGTIHLGPNLCSERSSDQELQDMVLWHCGFPRAPCFPGRLFWMPSLKADLDGVQEYSMLNLWPVRMPRPSAQKLLANTPLITGQRVLDALFPSVLGGGFTFLHIQIKLCCWPAFCNWLWMHFIVMFASCPTALEVDVHCSFLVGCDGRPLLFCLFMVAYVLLCKSFISHSRRCLVP